MAVDYTNLFENIGEYVQRVNDFIALYAALDTDLSEIESELQSNGRYDILSGQYEKFLGFKQQVLSWASDMRSKVVEILTHRTTVLAQLNLAGNSDLSAVLKELHRAMVDDEESIEACEVTIGAVVEDKENTNAGSVLTSKVLDGYSAPHTSYPANPHYANVDSELSGTSDTIVITCINDSETDSATEGHEKFTYGGKPAQGNAFDWYDYGSGTGSSIQPLQASTIFTNCEFEDFTSNAPTGWDIDAGVAGTHIFEETVNVQRGDSALKFTGDAALASIKISQTMTDRALVPLRRYIVGFWVEGHADITDGTLTIQFEGTGYTAASGEKIEMDDAALAAATAYTFKHFWITMPAEIPDDFELVIKWTGTPSAHSIYVDGGGVAPAVYYNGIAFAIYAGSEKFLREDRFTFTVTNDNNGVFQTFFRKAFGVQLPSSGAPTQADTLAT